MERKLIKQGNSALTVTLPAKWAKNNNLAAGDDIEINEEDNNIVISSTKKNKKTSHSIKINLGNESFTRIILNNLYRTGSDKITINFLTDEDAEIISSVTNDLLLGFEVTEKKKNKIVIEDITGLSEEKQNILLRRTFLMIKESLNILNEDTFLGEFNHLKEIKEHTRRVSSYDNYCRRTISKFRFNKKKEHFYWGLYVHLNSLQRSISHLYESMDNLKVKTNKETKKISTELLKGYGLMYDGFFKKDLELINKGNKATNNLLHKMIHSQMKISKGEETILLFYLGKMSRTIYLTTGPILGILLN